jgi:hypothetical protein
MTIFDYKRDDSYLNGLTPDSLANKTRQVPE